MEDEQIQQQHTEREKVEQNPEIEQVRLPIVDCRLSIESPLQSAIGN
jgi:hypothetical protein